MIRCLPVGSPISTGERYAVALPFTRTLAPLGRVRITTRPVPRTAAGAGGGVVLLASPGLRRVAGGGGGAGADGGTDCDSRADCSCGAATSFTGSLLAGGVVRRICQMPMVANSSMTAAPAASRAFLCRRSATPLTCGAATGCVPCRRGGVRLTADTPAAAAGASTAALAPALCLGAPSA